MDLSLSSSLSDSRAQSSASSAYRTAARLFVNQKFPESLEALKPVIDQGIEHGSGRFTNDTNADVNPESFQPQTYVKAWGLYFALLDTSQKRPDSWSKVQAKEILDLLSSDQLWIKAESVFGNGMEIPVEVFNGLVGLSARYCKDEYVPFTVDKVQSYLSTVHAEVRDPSESHPQFMLDYQQLVSIFLLQLLPRLKEFDMARGFVEGNGLLSDTKKQELVMRIDDLETAETTAASNPNKPAIGTKQSMDGITDNDVSNVMTTSRSSSSSSVSTLSEYSNSTNISELTPVQPTPMTEEDRRSQPQSQGQGPNSSSNILAPGSSSGPHRPPTSVAGRIFNHWKLTLSRAYERHGSLSSVSSTFLFSLLAFVLAFLLSFPRIRTRIRSQVSRTWSSIFRTLAMGMKVSQI